VIIWKSLVPFTSFIYSGIPYLPHYGLQELHAMYSMHFAELMMPTLWVKYILCKILVSDSVLRKDFFP